MRKSETVLLLESVTTTKCYIICRSIFGPHYSKCSYLCDNKGSFFGFLNTKFKGLPLFLIWLLR